MCCEYWLYSLAQVASKTAIIAVMCVSDKDHRVGVPKVVNEITSAVKAATWPTCTVQVLCQPHTDTNPHIAWLCRLAGVWGPCSGGWSAIHSLHSTTGQTHTETHTHTHTHSTLEGGLDRQRGAKATQSLKMAKVCLYIGNTNMETYAILDDWSERTILLHSTAQQLGVQGRSEDLALRTIRQDIKAVPGRSVSVSVSPAGHP